METENAPAPAPAPRPNPIETMLSEFLGRARSGELTSLVICYANTAGGAAVQSSPMSPIMMNHLSKLLERRVTREYDQALTKANTPRPGTGAGAVPEQARVAAQLPRKVRRAVKRSQDKLLQHAEKTAKKPPAAPEV